MKVWIICKDDDPEGYSEPLCAYSSKSNADKARAELLSYRHAEHGFDIFELEVDIPPT